MTIDDDTIELPEALGFLLDPHRYKVAWGGRGGAKSWNFARVLLCKGAARPLRILCARETQKSLAESVHHLLSEQIAALGLHAHYRILEGAIYGVNGTEFRFAGLKHNITNIKSLESFDIVWVEEAQVVSKHSWETLIPTIRKDGSEIWISFNPELDTDDTYTRFVVSPPSTAKVVKVTWRDNPWFPETLRQERAELLAKDPVACDHIYEGNCRSAQEGAIYEAELRAAMAAGRIGKVPYDPTAPVHTFWDLGFGDMVSIWMAQAIGFEYRLIDYEQSRQKPLGYYLQQLQARPYIWGTDFLPWDGAAAQLGSGRSIQELMMAAGRNVQVVQRTLITDGINAVRTIFPLCHFDEERCAEGIKGLRHYRWGDPAKSGQERSQPLHDWASHPADALRTMGVSIQHPEKKRPKAPPAPASRGKWR